MDYVADPPTPQGVTLKGEVGSPEWQLSFFDALWLLSLAHPENVPPVPPC
jgi:hypothetical protein